MSDIHIEEFYHDIGLILSRLYSSFPRPANIYVQDIAGTHPADEFGLHSDRHMSCFSAMIWLKKQGYIDFESTMKQEAIDQAVLTQKSFLTLSNQASISLDEPIDLENLPPYAAKNAITNIAILRKALKTQSAINIGQIVFHLMEQSNQFNH
jgi:hypothetical protein